MGFFEGIVPNLTGLGEGTDTLIFPAESSIQKEIPLYLRLVCTEYSMNGIARSGLKSVGLQKANIYVPVPSKLVTQTAMRYKQEENDEFMRGALQKKVEEGIKLKSEQIATALGTGLTKILPPQAAGYGADVARNLARSFNQMIDTDFTETILQSGSKRSFTISLYMPCLNQADSLSAAKITRAFEALALPSMIGAGISAVGGAQLHFHPPMWFFGIGPLKSVRSDLDWTSQPQASVLTNVAVSRTAIDASSFTALDGNIKPAAYSVTLNFQEIETAFRVPTPGQATSFGIKNRSGALSTGAGAAVGLLTPTG